MEIPSFLTDYANYLKDISYRHSKENLTFTKNKAIAHRAYMAGYRKTTPYLHPDDWQDDREGNLSSIE